MFQDSSEPLTIKLLFLGDLHVGKSSFIHRYIEDKFTNDRMTTTDLDLKTADIIIEDKNIRVQLWDTAGQERYKSISKNLISRVQGILILFDITNENSFTNLNAWLKTIKDQDGKMPIIMVGNKCDLEEKRVVKKEDAKTFAKNEKMKYIETSCKTGENVKNTIDIFCKHIMKNTNLKNEISFSLDSTEPIIKNKKCC